MVKGYFIYFIGYSNRQKKGIKRDKNMKSLMMVFLMSIILVSCKEQETKINYKIAEGYFVLNTVPNNGAYDKKITTQKEFDEHFGMATTMNSTPTHLDFDREFVAAYILPETDMQTSVEVDSVCWNGRQTEMYLSLYTGEKQTYTIRPVKILLIDKKYEGGLTTFVNHYGER